MTTEKTTRFPALRGALGFGLGSAATVLLLVARDSPGPLVPILGYLVPGVIGPLALVPLVGGWWPALRGAVGFGFGSLFVGLSFILMLFYFPFGIAWLFCLAVSFGLAGAMGGACLALGWRVFFRSAGCFALGGVAGAGVLLVIQPLISRFLLHSLSATPWSGSTGTVDFFSFGLSAILVPYVAGGALLGGALAARTHA